MFFISSVYSEFARPFLCVRLGMEGAPFRDSELHSEWRFDDVFLFKLVKRRAKNSKFEGLRYLYRIFAEFKIVLGKA